MAIQYRQLENFAKYIATTSAEFTAINPLLQPGEIGVETDTGLLKIGNGFERWNDLTTGSGGGDVDLSDIEADIAAIEAAITGYAEGISGGTW